MHTEGSAASRTVGVDPPNPQHTKPLYGFLSIKILSPFLSSGGGDTKLLIGTSILKKELTQVTFSLGISSSLGANRLRTWNCRIFAELGSKLKSLSLRRWEDLMLNSGCSRGPSFLLWMGSSSYLSVLRGVSVAKGAGDHQDQSFMFQVHNVVFFHGHHLGGEGWGQGKEEVTRRERRWETSSEEKMSHLELSPLKEPKVLGVISLGSSG